MIGIKLFVKWLLLPVAAAVVLAGALSYLLALPAPAAALMGVAFGLTTGWWGVRKFFEEYYDVWH